MKRFLFPVIFFPIISLIVINVSAYSMDEEMQKIVSQTLETIQQEVARVTQRALNTNQTLSSGTQNLDESKAINQFFQENMGKYLTDIENWYKKMEYQGSQFDLLQRIKILEEQVEILNKEVELLKKKS